MLLIALVFVEWYTYSTLIFSTDLSAVCERQEATWNHSPSWYPDNDKFLFWSHFDIGKWLLVRTDYLMDRHCPANWWELYLHVQEMCNTFVNCNPLGKSNSKKFMLFYFHYTLNLQLSTPLCYQLTKIPSMYLSDIIYLFYFIIISSF